MGHAAPGAFTDGGRCQRRGRLFVAGLRAFGDGGAGGGVVAAAAEGDLDGGHGGGGAAGVHLRGNAVVAAATHCDD